MVVPVPWLIEGTGFTTTEGTTVQDGSWLDGVDDTDSERKGPTTRLKLLLALAALPWLVVVALLVLPGRIGGAPSPSVAGMTLQPDSTVSGEELRAGNGEDGEIDALEPQMDLGDGIIPDGFGSRTGAPFEAIELLGSWRADTGPQQAAALGVVIARAWLTGLEPRLAIDGIQPVDPDRYAEHLVVEAVDQPTPEAAVVTLLAVLLDDRGGLSAAVRRLAVPIAWELDGPRPAGTPWWLPGPDLETLTPERVAIDAPEDHLAALDALAVAGIDDVELLALWGTSGWPVIADVAAGDGRTASIWLRRHRDGFAVAGTAFQSGTGQGPADLAYTEVRP